jgi:hypothetical protein
MVFPIVFVTLRMPSGDDDDDELKSDVTKF